MPEKQKKQLMMNKARNKSIRVTIAYFIFGCIWIIATDVLARIFTADPCDIVFFHIAKGLFYVLFTAFFVYKLIYSVLKELVDSEEKLKESELLFRTIFEESPIGIAVSKNGGLGMNMDHVLISMNSKFEQISGRTANEIVDVGWPEVTHHEDLKEDLEKFRKLQLGEINSYTMQKRFIKPDETIVWVDMVVARLHQTNSHICLVQDITERKSIENALLESERSKSVLLSNLPGLAYRCNYDRNLTMQYVSDGCFALTGYPSDHLIDSSVISFHEIIAPEYRDSLRKEWEQILPLRLPLNFEYEIITAAGQRKWVLELGQGIYDSHGKAEALEGIVIDITDRKEYELMLKHLSEYDSWTGLHNRTYFENILKTDFKRNVHGQNAIVVVNLSPIHLLSLTHGFHYAQALIKRVSAVLSGYCTDQCQLFNTYVNRFAFYLKNYRDRTELIEFSKEITKILESMLFMERISAGIGIYEIEGSETNVEQVLKNVLIASENALNNMERSFSYCFFDAEMESQLLRNEEIKNELSQIAAGEKENNLYLQFQPILDLNSNSIFGFEALARLKSDKLGVISPLEFISIAEKTALIIPIGKIIINKAFHFLNKLKTKGFQTNISINISSIQILRPEFHSDLVELINEMGINPSNITLEITESLFSDNYYEINRKLGELKDMGIHIAIDDFGTGYSSLARERELNVDYLKIDKSFIDNLSILNSEKSITGDIISMAHKLGHCVVAEGVENEKQKQYLEEYHCDKIQGYLISRPLSSEQAMILLEEQVNLAPKEQSILVG